MLPISYGFMAHLDAALMEQTFEIPKREQEPHIEHHRKADDLGARFEVLERAAFCHLGKLQIRPARLKTVLADKAP